MKTWLALLLIALALPAWADRFSVPKHAAFDEECASCHLAYPPQLLDAVSWRALMENLPRHFGVDASLDDNRRLAITDFLTRHAGRGGSTTSSGKPLLRITETPWFRREHDEIAAPTWQRTAIKSPANCAACHTQAASGDFRERNIHIPKRGTP